jgi:excinuclease ABC subunit C
LVSSYSHLPQKPGVYIFLDNNNHVLYVGKAIDLKSRVSSYFVKNADLLERTRLLVSKVRKIRITIVETELEALLLEAFYIKKYHPRYNVRLSDDKSYIRIRIVAKDDYPPVLLARSNTREKSDKRSIYYGPYPDARSVKLVLRTIRKIYPFVSVPNHPKRICLYYHLGLCPCPPVFDTNEYQKQYRKNILGIKRILEGKSRAILSEFEKQRDALSKQEKYEEAHLMQKRINALSIITQPRRQPFEYHLNPNLRSDLRRTELSELESALREKGLDTTDLTRIECFDISNTQGVFATGSMVVFTNGERNSSQYKRFKIKKSGTPNDFAMMAEVIQRRLKHLDDWGIPSLIIVDGGKGQVSSGLRALSINKIKIPLIGLAKREETIILPKVSRVSKVSEVSRVYEDLEFTEISLPKNSPALHLIMRIRDEAHRFAITYHKLLRSKNALLQK